MDWSALVAGFAMLERRRGNLCLAVTSRVTVSVMLSYGILRAAASTAAAGLSHRTAKLAAARRE